jgi:membrane protein implicated in regulation of membrane protease activity
MYRTPADLTLLGTGALVVLALLALGFDSLPLHLLGHIGLALLLWAVLSTLVVAALGAWVAVARTRRGRMRLSRQQQTLH